MNIWLMFAKTVLSMKKVCVRLGLCFPIRRVARPDLGGGAFWEKLDFFAPAQHVQSPGEDLSAVWVGGTCPPLCHKNTVQMTQVLEVSRSDNCVYAPSFLESFIHPRGVRTGENFEK